MVSIRKQDGSISKTQAWNIGWIVATSAFTVAVTILPELAAEIPRQWYLGLALFVKTGDMVLRQITSQPMR